MRQMRIIAISIFMTGLILVGFQNCGQPGQLTTSQSVPGAVSNSLEIGAPVSDTLPTASPAVVNPVTIKPPSSELPPADSTITINDTSHEAICRDLTASDVLLNIDQVQSDGASLKLTGPDHAISIAQAAVSLEATSSGKVSEIRLILNPAGNLVLGTNNVTYDLKTPSGQTSGFKVHLALETEVQAGHKYELELNVDLSQQIVRAGKKCILKPVIKNASLKQI